MIFRIWNCAKPSPRKTAGQQTKGQKKTSVISDVTERFGLVFGSFLSARVFRFFKKTEKWRKLQTQLYFRIIAHKIGKIKNSLILFSQILVKFFFILHKAYVTCQNSLQDFKTEKHNLTVEIIFAIWYYL